jgi:hypothetical protein
MKPPPAHAFVRSPRRSTSTSCRPRRKTTSGSPRPSPVQPKPEPADWTELEVPYAEPEIPQEVVDQEVEELRASIAELAPVEGRPAHTGDVLVIDVLDENGEGQRDLVVELGSGRLVEEIERALIGASPGESKNIEFELADGSTGTATVEVKELKEKVLPPLDDELARSASEFDTLEELRADIEGRIRDVLEEEAETQYRRAPSTRSSRPPTCKVGGPLVEARTRRASESVSAARSKRAESTRTPTCSSRPDCRTARAADERRRRRFRSRVSSCSRPSPTSSVSRSRTPRSRS